MKSGWVVNNITTSSDYLLLLAARMAHNCVLAALQQVVRFLRNCYSEQKDYYLINNISVAVFLWNAVLMRSWIIRDVHAHHVSIRACKAFVKYTHLIMQGVFKCVKNKNFFTHDNNFPYVLWKCHKIKCRVCHLQGMPFVEGCRTL